MSTVKDRLDRRTFLILLNAGGLSTVAGCVGDDNNGGSNVNSNSDPDDDGGGSGDADDADGNVETDANDDTDDNNGPQIGPQKPPGPVEEILDENDPRFVVANDGTGDYEDLQEATEVAQDGDLIEIKAGQYSWEPNYNRIGTTFDNIESSIKFKGTGPKNTTLTIDFPENARGGDKIQISKNQLHFSDISIGMQPKSGTIDVASKGSINIQNCVVYGRLRGRITASQSSFKKGVRIELDNIEQCSGTQLTMIQPEVCKNNNFDHLVIGEGGGNPYGVEMQYNSFGKVTLENYYFDWKVTNSRIGPPKEGRRSIEINDGLTDSGGFHQCHIVGLATNGTEDLDPGLVFTNNIFEADQDMNPNLLVDNIGKRFVKNAFINGDIRVNSENVVAFDEESKRGNYYSSFNGEDKDGDGVSELPRKIPGDGGVTDQYPLMEIPSKLSNMI